MKQYINGKELGKSIIFLFLFCYFWLYDFGYKGFFGVILNLVVIVVFALVFIDALGKSFVWRRT
jgi:hypothetical protein